MAGLDPAMVSEGAGENALPQNRPERAVPVLAGRVVLEVRDARQMQVIELLAGAGELAALLDQFARLVPLLAAQRLEDVIVKGEQGAEFRAGAHHLAAQHGIELDRLVIAAGR